MAKHVVSRGILALLCMVIVLLSGTVFAQNSDEESDNAHKTGELRVVVTGVDEESSSEETARPIQGAKVFVTWTDEDKELDWDATTNSDGVAKLTEVRHGALKILVVAKRWEPFGQKYQLKPAEHTIRIRLEIQQAPQ